MNSLCALVLLADGFEEIEALTAVDILRRAGVSVTTAGLRPGPIEASRQTRHLADALLDAVSHRLFDVLVLPGGQPGTNNLRSDRRVGECVVRHARAGKWLAAICAAPLVLHDVGLLAGRRVTSHPSVKDQLVGVHYLEDRVVLDGTILTSRAPGTALEFSLRLVEILCGANLAAEINQGVLARL
jgi:4-methyl-5(b-hydroxyethyl)-thiazole monophosphate biosynthesis